MRVTRRGLFEFLAGAGAVVGIQASQAPPKISETYEPKLEDGPAPNSLNGLHLSSDYYSVVDDTIYDRVVFPAGFVLPARFHLFRAGVGEVCPYNPARVKGLQDTNLWSPAGLPAPQQFWIRSLHLVVRRETSARDLASVRQFGWEFFLCDRCFAGGCCSFDTKFGSAQQISKTDLTTRATLRFHTTKGLYLPSQMPFKATFETSERMDSSPLHYSDSASRFVVDPDGSGLEIGMALEGVRWRAVQ
jgi:hypothetical protein